MRAYMVWGGGDPGDGAVLVLAETSHQARTLGAPACLDFGYCDEWTQVRSRWMKDADVPYLLGYYGAGLTDSPDCCDRCEKWTGQALDDGLCGDCWAYREDEREAVGFAQSVAQSADSPPRTEA